MADETPKLIQIGKGGPGIKKDGFNLISEKVVKVDVENQTLEIELLAYEGKTVMLEVGEDLVEELKKRSEEHTSELQSPCNLVCRLLLEKKKNNNNTYA